MDFDDFRYRYNFITKGELRNNKSKFIELIGEELYNKYINILNLNNYRGHDLCAILVDSELKTLIAVVQTTEKSFLIDRKYTDLSVLKEYKVSNKMAYNQNIINMAYINGNIIDTYAIDNIWALIHYTTSNGNHRLLLNPNAFGRFNLFNTRDYKIYKLLK